MMGGLNRTTLAVALAVLMAASAKANSADPPPATKRVLILHQELASRPQRARFNVAFLDQMRALNASRVEIFEESLDTERLPGSRQLQLTTDYLAAKYSDVNIDVIVAVGKQALDFSRQHRSTFGEPSIVAVAPTGLVPPEPGIAGLQGSGWIEGTIDLARALEPGLNRLIVVDGTRDLTTDYQPEIEAQLNARHLAMDYLRNRPLDEVIDRVGSAPSDSAILYVRQTMRNGSQPLDPFEGLARVVSVSPVPVFSHMEEYLGRGIVGGRIWQFEPDAKRMASMVVGILKGSTPETFSIEPSTYATVVDWRQLQTWAIPSGRIPVGAVVLNRSQSLYQQHPLWIAVGTALFVGQLLLIGGLLLQRRQLQRADEATRAKAAELAESESRNLAMLRAIPDLMFVLTRDGRYVDYHAKDPRLLYRSPSDFLGKRVPDIMPEPLATRMMTAIAQVSETSEPVVVEYQLDAPEPRYFETRLVLTDTDRILSMVRDVTEIKRTERLNHQLTGRLITSQEVERQRIARELHDNVSQKLALLNLEIDQLAMGIPPGRTKLGLEDASDRVGGIATELHGLSHALHPGKLETMGLVAALQALCRDVQSATSLEIDYTCPDRPLPDVDASVALCVYRVVQEALNNVAKHSHALRASVLISSSNGDIRVQVEDAGIGFAEHAVDGLGLRSMKERVALVQGELMVHSQPGGGTRVGVRVPERPPAGQTESMSSSVAS
jgi:signal transduction histidine kinase